MNFSDLQTRCYVPYSNCAVVAVIQSQSGHYFPGIRVENISFPLTISAVQNALFNCLSEGEKPATIYVEHAQTSGPVLACWTDQYHLEIKNLGALDDISMHPVVKNLNEKEIYGRLQERLDNPFVEYSRFPVSALLETKQGFISGINIEMRSWNLGLCAERIALSKALSYGISDFKALHLTTLHGDYNSPCGACRQVIIEHLSHHPVYLYYADGSRSMHFSSDLLPYHFQSTKLQEADS